MGVPRLPEIVHAVQSADPCEIFYWWLWADKGAEKRWIRTYSFKPVLRYLLFIDGNLIINPLKWGQ